jgi:MFS family permease
MAIRTISRMYVLIFFFSLHTALSLYVNSTFLGSTIGEQYVGLLYTLSAALTLVALSKTTVALKRLGNRTLTMRLLLLNLASVTTFIITKNPIIIGIGFTIFAITNSLVLLCLDIFVEHFGNPATIGKTRGFYLTIENLAIMASPLATGWLITYAGGYRGVYLVAALTVAGMLACLRAAIPARAFSDATYEKIPLLAAYGFLKKNRHIRAITVINFMLQFFFVWMIIYTPVYLHEHIGFGWGQIGIIFTIMLAPFVLFGIPLGKLIDDYHVPKRLLLAIGIMLMGISTIGITFITSTSVILWAVILFTTRLGAVCIETVSEIYFFTHVHEKEAYLLSIFRDMVPLAYVIAPVLGTLLLSYIPFKYLFTVLGIIVLSSLYSINHLKHHHEHEIGISPANQ